MKRVAYLIAGLSALLLAAIGAVVPLLPTVPFVLLAAFCLARSNPALEKRLVEHPTFGPHIAAWRSRRAISRQGKRAAYLGFAFSALLGLALLQWPLALAPAAAGVAGATWISRQRTA